MKRRWAFMFWPSLLCLIGISWSITKYGGSVWDLMGIQMLGMIAACLLGFVGMRSDARRKAPAIIALVCAAPMLLTFVHVARDVDLLWRYFGFSVVLVYGGGGVTALSAIVIAVLPLPPVESEPIAQARTVREDAR